MKNIQVVCLCVFVLVVPALHAQTAAAPVDASGVWNALQSPAMDPAKTATVDNLEIVRDRVHITLKSGTIQFAQPVNGIVFAAVFRGEGRIQVDPPNPIEAQQLRLFTKQDKLDMTFTEAAFTFTDSLFDEVARQVKWFTGAAGDGLYAKRQQDRENLGSAQLPRLFKSVLSGDRKRTAYFLADLHTKEKGWVEVAEDAMEQEEISVGRWADVGPVKIFDTWMSFPAGGRSVRDAWNDPDAKSDFVIRGYRIDTTVTTNAELSADARVTLEPRLAGERILLFRLDSNLRLESVADGQGKALAFYQARETKDRYQSYGDYVAVVLPAPFPTGQTQTLEFRYDGKRAIRKVHEGHYFCETSGWYPERPNSFASRADFELTFHSPKNFVLVATGEKASETQAESVVVTTWKSAIPLAVAGYAYGDYKVYNAQSGPIAVDVYANRGYSGYYSIASWAKIVGDEMANTVLLFQQYFGPYPYKHLAVTSLPFEYSYGQGWPGLIYLWADSFVNPTVYAEQFRGHESSHQWWGQRVGWKSYHDQWLSEGFAEFSGVLYVQYQRNWKEALSLWRIEKEHLRYKDHKGHTIESLGPIWLGQRIGSSETDGGSYQNLIYSKGAYVLQMLRMMLYDTSNPDPDHLFRAMMWDYCKTFDNKPASTEDFKAIVEKHMLPSMRVDGTQRMDWFFNEYVYGLGIPKYTFNSTTELTPDGKTHMKLAMTRSGVPEDWKDVIPIYGHVGDKTIKLGCLRVLQSSATMDTTVPGKID